MTGTPPERASGVAPLDRMTVVDLTQALAESDYDGIESEALHEGT